jgi:hypothetical protein
MQPARKAYPSKVSDGKSAFVAPYLALLPEDTRLREVFNSLMPCLMLH